MADSGIGASVERKEDHRLLTGKGHYVADMNIRGQAHAAFVRSPHAHAVIESVDTSEAQQASGVVAVFTGEDTQADGVGGLPCGWLIHDISGEPMKEPPHPPLAHSKVRYVGDHVAVVIAETEEQARDAAELVEVEYDMLDAVVTAPDALADGAPAVHDEAPDNRSYTWAIGDKDATDAAFGQAAHVTKLDLVNNRVVPNAIEPRAALADYDSGSGQYTVYTTSQNPHLARLLLCAFVLGLPEHKVRVVAPDVGGGFGSKIYVYAEETVVTWAAHRIGRPVKWVAQRSESFVSDAHGRDHVTHAELALAEDGTFLGLDVDTKANLGAYLSTFGSAVPTYLYGTLMAGQYTTPAIHCQVTGTFTHTAPVDAYRGAGRPEAAYVVERLVEAAAREMNMNPGDIRRKNFIREFPYETPVALAYDTGDFDATLDGAEELIDLAGFEQRRQEAANRGKYRGIGYASYIEACGLAPSNLAGQLGARAGLYEAGEVRLNPTGSVTVFTGTHPHGQGHETSFAQLVADRLGLPFDNIEVVHGDTDRIPFGMGTYGSRALAVGGSAISKALDKVVAKSKKVAAHMLEAAESDIEFEDGTFSVAGTDKSISMAEIAFSAYVPHNYPLEELEPGLDENAYYDPANFTYPGGTHICEVEIDPETGSTRVVNFAACDDFGTIINPMLVDGQVHGGVAQGIGQALMEGGFYDRDSGQLVTGSYMDYTMPRADDLPNYTVATRVTPCTHNPLGVKGAGEAGAIGSPPAVINAIIDALQPLGVNDIQMPATPLAVWQAIQKASGSQASAG